MNENNINYINDNPLFELICKKMNSLKSKSVLFIFLIISLLFKHDNLYCSTIESDSLPLLLNIDIQIETTEAINLMYNFEFEKADKQFRWLVQEYNWHPLPYFLLGLSTWWKIASDLDNKELDDEFFYLMDTSIVLSEKIYKNYNKIEAAFFLAASYGFKGRLLSERRKWRKAAFAGRNALKYLREVKGEDKFIPEISFGNGLFNYYSIWVGEEYPLLKPIINLFPKGDKELGINQLDNAAKNSFYTRTEAQFFLMKILSQENKISQAIQISSYLNNIFPDNSIFHTSNTSLLYRSNRLIECEKEALSIIKKFNINNPGYQFNSVRQASFFLGEIYRIRSQFDLSIKYYKKSIEMAKKIDAERMGYTLYSYFSLGEYAFDKKNYLLSKKYFSTILGLTKRKEKINSDSRIYLKKMKKLY